MIAFSSASDVASWLGVVLGALSLLVAGFSFRRAKNAQAAVLAVRTGVRRRDLVDALDLLDQRRLELERLYRDGDPQLIEEALREWRRAAQQVSNQLGPSGSRARQEAWSALEHAVRDTSRMAGLGPSIPVGAKTMEDAIAEIDRCQRACGRLHEEVRQALSP